MSGPATDRAGAEGFVLLRNAEAGDDDAAAVRAVADALQVPAEVVATDGPDGLDEALGALDGRTPVVCGGDGSIHLAVERLRARGRLADTALGLVPLGTGNDLAGSLGIPPDPRQAAGLLAAGRARRLDLLVSGDGAVCVNALHAGVGVDAAEQATDLKGALGKLAYPLGAALAAVSAEGLEVTVTVDGAELAPTGGGGAALMVAIGNAPTIGGGTPVLPDAEPDDGQLDVMVSHAIGPGARAAFGGALRSGTHGDRDDVATGRGRQVSITGRPVAYNVDGELFGDRFEERTWRIQPGAWRLIAPPRDGPDPA